MKILCIEYEPSSKRGGQEFSMLDECVGLAARGHAVTLGYGASGDLLPRYAAGGVRTADLGEVWWREEARLRSGIRFTRAVARATRLDADLICINEYHESLFGSAVARLRDIPLVLHLRLMPPGTFCGQWRIGVSQVTRFIAVSGAVKEAWVERGCDPSRVDVVHDGIDVERFRPYPNRDAVRDAIGVPRDAFMLIFAGRLDPQKRPEAMLRVFASLGLPPSRARLVIAGGPVVHKSSSAGDDYVATLKRLADSLGIAESVHWLGKRTDVPELLSAADLSILFTLYPEALARTTYESLACGTPALAQRDGGMAEVLTGEFRRFAFDGTRPDEVVALIRSMLDWRRRDPGLAARARAHAVAHFSTASMVAGIEASMRRALETLPRHRGPSRARLRERRDESTLVTVPSP